MELQKLVPSAVVARRYRSRAVFTEDVANDPAIRRRNPRPLAIVDDPHVAQDTKTTVDTTSTSAPIFDFDRKYLGDYAPDRTTTEIWNNENPMTGVVASDCSRLTIANYANQRRTKERT